MENLIEKLKTVDKKVWIGVGIGAAALIILIVVLVVGGGNKPAGGNTQGTQKGTETEVGATEVFGTEDVTEVIGTEEATETEMGTETEMTESESQAQNQGGNQSGNQGGNQGGTTSNVTVTQPESVGGVEQKPVTTTPDGQEILGLGSASQPYEYLSEATSTGVKVTTVEVPAGKTLYYKINKIGGMRLNISDSDLYIIDSAGVRHDSSFIVEDALASDFVLLQIGNKGSANKAFTIKFTNIKGTWENPEVINSLGATTNLSYGNDTGYYYKFVATQAGTIRFYIDSQTNASDISVTNNNDMKNRTFSANAATDAQGRKYIELDGVKAGDVLMINVCAVPDATWSYPATTVVWHGEYYTGQ